MRGPWPWLFPLLPRRRGAAAAPDADAATLPAGGGRLLRFGVWPAADDGPEASVAPADAAATGAGGPVFFVAFAARLRSPPPDGGECCVPVMADGGNELGESERRGAPEKDSTAPTPMRKSLELYFVADWLGLCVPTCQPAE